MNGDIKVSSTFDTKEIGLVAYFELNAVKPSETKVIKLNSNGKRIAQFWFHKSDQALELKKKYFDGVASVEPVSFQDAIRKIKTRINNLDG